MSSLDHKRVQTKDYIKIAEDAIYDGDAKFEFRLYRDNEVHQRTLDELVSDIEADLVSRLAYYYRTKGKLTVKEAIEYLDIDRYLDKIPKKGDDIFNNISGSYDENCDNLQLYIEGCASLVIEAFNQ